MNNNPFRKATRKASPIKLLLTGNTGTGKTYTALAVACHMAHDLGGRVAVIDTECGEAALYADTPCACSDCRGQGISLDYDHIPLDDCNPDNFVGLMRDAYRNGYTVLVIDSASHEWSGKPGCCLDLIDKLKGQSNAKRASDNAWSAVTPKHEAFIAAIQATPTNLIVTARLKVKRDDTTQGGSEEIVQRSKDGTFDYEFTFAARCAKASVNVYKARADELQGRIFSKAGASLARMLVEWSGQQAASVPSSPSLPAVKPETEPTIHARPPRPAGAKT